MKVFKILIVDDHAMLREGVRGLIAKQSDMECAGEAGDGLTAVKLAKKLQPDVVLMDISLPKLDGIEATREIKHFCPQVRVIAFTAHESLVVFNQLRLAGVDGFLHKFADGPEILAAMRTVGRGGEYFDPELLAKAGRAAPVDPGTVKMLSARETEVMRLLAQGYVAKEVAARLNVSTKSVETYKGRLMVKLGINSRVELMRYAQMKFPSDRP